MKHKHAELIKAWADGAEIETRAPSYGVHEWQVEKYPCWGNAYWEYRIKPFKNPDEVKYLFKNYPREEWIECDATSFMHDVLKVIRDGETGKIKAVEIIG